MYNFSSNIRIRTCDELSFFINITNNNIFVIKTRTLEFLQIKLKNGLTKENLNELDSSFITFINELDKQNILEVIKDEI